MYDPIASMFKPVNWASGGGASVEVGVVLVTAAAKGFRFPRFPIALDKNA